MHQHYAHHFRQNYSEQYLYESLTRRFFGEYIFCGLDEEVIESGGEDFDKGAIFFSGDDDHEADEDKADGGISQVGKFPLIRGEVFIVGEGPKGIDRPDFSAGGAGAEAITKQMDEIDDDSEAGGPESFAEY